MFLPFSRRSAEQIMLRISYLARVWMKMFSKVSQLNVLNNDFSTTNKSDRLRRYANKSDHGIK